MNLHTAIAQTLTAARRPPQQTAPTAQSRTVRTARSEREFGTGYGNSSGYATGKRYVRDWGNARFRFA